MLDLARLVHEAIGIENPRAFIALFALTGLLFFGCVGWLIDNGYRTKLREEAAAASAVAMQEPQEAVPDSGEEPPIHIEQHNEAPNTRSYAVGKGNLTVYESPGPLVLSSSEKLAAIQALKETPLEVHIVSLSNLPGYASPGAECELGKDVIGIFREAGWIVRTSVLGAGPIQPGITVSGRQDNDTVQRVVSAFTAAQIPHRISDPIHAAWLPEGLAITVAPDQRR